MKERIFGVLQRVGRSFMLPIAILPVAGLFLGIGGSLTNKTMIEAYGLSKVLGEGTFLNAFLTVLSKSGDIVFANLPIIFAIGVAIGMAKKEKEVAALSGAIAFFVMHAAVSAMIGVYHLKDKLPEGSITSVVGIESLQMGVFGGIIVGLGVAALHNRFYKIQLPQVLSFFGGTRFIPIISSIVYLVVGILMSYIWPTIQEGIYAVGDIVRNSGYFGTWIYGLMERALIPFGLHHVFYLPFWQTGVGGSAEIGGQLVEGAQNIFFAELASGDTTRFSVEATRFMSGKFPLMIFGLPGAALAMYRMALPEKRKIVGGLLISAALTSMLTGITEPIEFTFLFVAPILYIIHCAFAGAAYMLMHIFKVGVGMTFSGGLIDLTLFGILQGNAKTNWIWVAIIGIGYFFVYYFLFSFMIQRFNYKTPGREIGEGEVKLYTRSDVNARAEAKKNASGKEEVMDEISAFITAGLGGKDNISDVDSCATRLRCTVIDHTLVDEGILKASGSAGIIRKGNGVQVIYGPRVSVIKSNLVDYLESGAVISTADVQKMLQQNHTGTQEQSNVVNVEENNKNIEHKRDVVNKSNVKNKTTGQREKSTEERNKSSDSKSEVFSNPISGEIKSITETPDPAFSEKMMGDGIVIFPESNEVFAPIDATVAFIFPTNHALGLVTQKGTELLIHVGIDTVKLEGRGFTMLVKEGDTVEKGQKLMEFDIDYLKQNAPSIATPFIVTNLEENQKIEIKQTGNVLALKEVFKKI